MTTLDCWLCSTPPSQISPKLLQTPCTCGMAIAAHSYGHPHSLAAVGCVAFMVALPLEPSRQDTDAQPALF